MMICQPGAIRRSTRSLVVLVKELLGALHPPKPRVQVPPALWLRSPPSKLPLTALFVVLLMVREEELLLGFAISRPELKS